MRLVSFAVRNYRSIANTAKLPIREGITTLIGPNNEGKSNMLRALVTALKVASKLEQASVTKQGKVIVSFNYIYDWEKDFPVALQNSKPEGESEFDLEFELSDDDVSAFSAEVGSSLNGSPSGFP